MEYSPTFISAKKVMDFYIEKLSQEETVEAQFALQYCSLKIMKYRTNCLLNALEDYPIELEK